LDEHLSLYLDWLNGVGYAIRTGLADPKGLRAQLEGSIIWHAWFIENLLTEIDRQTSDSRAPAPGWIDLVRLVHKEIVGEVPTEPAQAAEGGELGGGGRRQRQGDGAGRVGVGLADGDAVILPSGDVAGQGRHLCVELGEAVRDGDDGVGHRSGVVGGQPGQPNASASWSRVTPYPYPFCSSRLSAAVV
jgi:hypothetical protein